MARNPYADDDFFNQKKPAIHSRFNLSYRQRVLNLSTSEPQALTRTPFPLSSLMLVFPSLPTPPPSKKCCPCLGFFSAGGPSLGGARLGFHHSPKHSVIPRQEEFVPFKRLSRAGQAFSQRSFAFSDFHWRTGCTRGFFFGFPRTIRGQPLLRKCPTRFC